jgi:hypothetical protein
VTDHAPILALHPSRRYTAIYVGLGVLLDAAAVGLILAPGLDSISSLVGWVALVFFGGVTVLLVIQLVWASRFGLTLDNDGFTVTMNLGRRRYLWKDVEKFFPYYTVAPYPVVAFKYRGKAEIRGLQWTRGVFGSFDGTLPQTLTIRGGALLDLVESWRQRATATTQ